MLLVNVAHGLLALYLLTLLAVPKVQTPLVALSIRVWSRRSFDRDRKSNV